MADYSVAWWTTPDGTQVYLDDRTNGLLTDRDNPPVGLGPIKRQFATDEKEGGGVRVRNVQTTPRSITFGLQLWGDTHQQFVDRHRALVAAFAQTDESGPGTLTIQRPDGAMRQIKAYFDDGLDAGLGGLRREATLAMTLYCPDGYFTDAAPTLITRQFSAAKNFLAPYLSVSSSQTTGQTVVTNPGDTEAYALWTITGPLTSLVADDLDNGYSFTFDATKMTPAGLSVGQSATIDTEAQQAFGPNGEDWSSAINWPQAILWPLPKGDTNVRFVLNGSGAGAQAALSFLARYKSA